jgi:hypothetical protein
MVLPLSPLLPVTFAGEAVQVKVVPGTLLGLVMVMVVDCPEQRVWLEAEMVGVGLMLTVMILLSLVAPQEVTTRLNSVVATSVAWSYAAVVAPLMFVQEPAGGRDCHW